MLKKFTAGVLSLVTVLAVSSVSVLATAAPASADTASNTLRSQAAVNAVAGSMFEEFETATTGCALHSAVKSVMNYTKGGRTVPIQIATQAVSVANKQGSGFCKAAIVIAGTIAQMQVTYSRYRAVYVKQVTNDPTFPWQKFKCERYIGRTSSTTTKWTYEV